MKKGIMLLICLLLILLVGCGAAGNGSVNKDSGSRTEHAEKGTVKKSSDILVLYFSRTGEQSRVGVINKGNTAVVAEMIAEKTGADLFEVKPANDNYPNTYRALVDMARRERKEGARPRYAGKLPDLSGYKTVYIGAPVWFGDWPMIMYTVFENNDFSGKKLAPFATHEGSGLAGFDQKLASACPKAEILSGVAIRGSDTQNSRESAQKTVHEWLAKLGN